MKRKQSVISIFLILMCITVLAQKKNNSSIYTTDYSDILVIPVGHPLPDSCQVIDKLNIGDNGYNMGCDYTSILKLAEKITKGAHGNILKINAMKEPDKWCDCYRLYGTVLYRTNLTCLKADKIDDSIVRYKFGDTAKYAILYVYRLGNDKGALVGYNVSIGDSTICRSKNNSGYEIKLRKEGKIKLFATTESSSSEELDVKFRHIYYLKCSIMTGEFVGKPYIENVDEYMGQFEYGKVKKLVWTPEQSKPVDAETNDR